MSKWQNPTWPYPHTAAAPNTWPNPAKQHEQYYASPSQGRPYPPGVPAEYDANNPAASSPPKTGFPPSASPQAKPEADETIPRPMIQQQPFAHMRPSYVNAPLGGPPAGQYPLHVPQYQMVPTEYGNYGNFQMHSEQWEQKPPVVGGIVGGEQPLPSFAKRSPKASSAPSPTTDSASNKEAGSDMDTSQSSAGNKVTKRSRMGCLTCRQRKKRCCETRPQCTECQRLRLKCVWPKPGTEHKNKPKEIKSQENMIDHDVYGKIKVLRGIVEYRSD